MTGGSDTATAPTVAVFAPHPLLSITIERRGVERSGVAADDIHLHPGGQGVWVARMAGELGASPVLCGMAGGETGAVLRALLDALPGERRLISCAAPSGCYVVDRRTGDRALVAQELSASPSRHELDDLFSVTLGAASTAAALVVTNPFPGEALPLEVYGNLVADARAAGTPVLVDLSSPRLDAALDAGPELVKLNDWELAQYVVGPVDGPRLRAGAERLREAGAQTVIVTRGGDPAFVLSASGAWELVPPKFDRGSREGCGDSMMGALAAGWAAGLELEDNLVRGAAAGAANFLRHGLGTGARTVIDELAARVDLRAI